MKKKNFSKISPMELDVDFIGEQGRSLTAEESALISEYIRKQNVKRIKSGTKKQARKSSSSK